MKFKNSQHNLLYISVCFFMFLAVFSFFFLNHQYKSDTITINSSINKRISDYQYVFSFISRKFDIKNYRELIKQYEQNYLYINNNTTITLGKIEAKFINKITNTESSEWIASSQNLQGKLLNIENQTITSQAYSCPELSPEFVIDLGYSFDMGDYKCLLKTTALLDDIGTYSPRPLIFFKQTNQQGLPYYMKTYFHEELGVVIGYTPNYHPLILLWLLSFLIYIAFSLFLVNKGLASQLRSLIFKNNNAEKEIESLKSKFLSFDHLNVGRAFDFKQNIPTTDVCIYEIIKQSIDDSSKEFTSIKFNIHEKHQPTIINTKKPYIVILFSLLIKHILKESPPNTTITCIIDVDNKNSEHSIAKIVFQDDLTFTAGICTDFFKSTIPLISSINIDVEYLIQELNIYVEFINSYHKGSNQIIIAVPILDNKNIESSNVIRFPN